MSILSASDLKLLNDFSKSQPALQRVGLPAAVAGVKLGDMLELAAASASAAAAAADVVLTHADVVLTHADVVLTHADVVLTHADVVSAAASAATLLHGQNTSAAITGHITVAGMTATGVAMAWNATTGAFEPATCGAGFIAVTPSQLTNWLVIKLS